MAAGVGAATIDQPTAAERTEPGIALGRARLSSGHGSSLQLSVARAEAISRDAKRERLQGAVLDQLQIAAEARARERRAALEVIATKAAQYASDLAADRWVLPLTSYSLTAGFGESSGLWSTTHTGLDFAAPEDTPIRSIASGIVRTTDYSGAYGNRVIVMLEDGTEMWYCHLAGFDVSVGDAIESGQIIGSVGSTGNVTGPHLHLEIRPAGGQPVDPYAVLSAHGLTP